MPRCVSSNAYDCKGVSLAIALGHTSCALAVWPCESTRLASIGIDKLPLPQALCVAKWACLTNGYRGNANGRAKRRGS
jgi:hypothetical protein